MEVMQRIAQILNNLPGILPSSSVRRLQHFGRLNRDDLRRDLDERALYDLAYNTIACRIEQIANVAAATVEGGKIRQIINLDPALLQGTASRPRRGQGGESLQPDPAVGDIKAKSRLQRIHQPVQNRGTDQRRRREDRRVAIPCAYGMSASSGSSDIQTNVVRTDGKRSVYLRVNKQPIANTVEVVDALQGHPENDRHFPRRAVGDFLRSVDLHPTIDQNLIEQALHGSLLAAAVILLF